MHRGTGAVCQNQRHRGAAGGARDQGGPDRRAAGLEHMVDTVLYFEAIPAAATAYCALSRTDSGRANEIGVFAMVEQGLREVTNPSAIFLSRHTEPVSGSVITVLREGTRSLLIEVQVLADSSLGANPRRVAVGIDRQSIDHAAAVAHRHAWTAARRQDIFANVVGGVRMTETAGDLAIVLAARSSLQDVPLPNSLIAFGELGLAGEIRPVPFGEDACARRRAWLQVGARAAGQCAPSAARGNDGARHHALESGARSALMIRRRAYLTYHCEYSTPLLLTVAVRRFQDCAAGMPGRKLVSVVSDTACSYLNSRISTGTPLKR